MDHLAAIDPREAVGGMWDEIGPLQLDTLRLHGLRPDHRVLDVGAGCLRGGVHIAKYLDRNRYWATDLSQVLLDEGAQNLVTSGLGSRGARLRIARDFTFTEVEDQKFDFVQAFGVFTDVPGDSIRECFANLVKVMAPNGRVFATFALGDQFADDPVLLQFKYPWSFFEGLGREFGWEIELIRGFKHPKGHSLLVARLLEARTPSI